MKDQKNSGLTVSELKEKMYYLPELAAEGRKKIEWAAKFMPLMAILGQAYEASRPLTGHTVAVCLHMEAKSAWLALLLQKAGAQVIACASNPLSTQDDVVSALIESGVPVFARYGASAEEYKAHLNAALNCKPDLLIDDGQDLVALLHTERLEQTADILGGCEETTTGIQRLKALESQGMLRFPMMAVNDAQMKYLFDNRYGTGQSVWDGIMRTTNLTVAGKKVVVAGYGWCGKGVSRRAQGLGAKVVVTEIDPIKANEALMDGFLVMPMLEAARIGDFFITVTGNIEVIRREHMAVMKDGAVLSNAGHFDVEVSRPDLMDLAVTRRIVRRNIEEFVLTDGRRLHLLAEGRLVNLAAGDGHPAEVMDLSFALQAESVVYLAQNHNNMEPILYSVPQTIDERIARLKLQSVGVVIDQLTEPQERYMASWQTDAY